jgi:hypothetical protein
LKTVVATLKSISPYSQSRHYDVDKKQGESHKDHEARTWRERMHADESGNVFIPPMAFKNIMSEIAAFLGMKIPGKRQATYRKHFEAGILVMEPVMLGLKKENVPGEWLFVPSDGKRGGGSRVDKCFPVMHEWAAEVRFYILDETVLQTMPDSKMTVFEHHLREAGSFIGIGRFRPRNNGFYGRFAVQKISIE